MAFCNGKLLVETSLLRTVSGAAISVLDAQTLELQGTFRTFTDNQTLTVCNNEVYVGSDTPGELCVLASTILTGNVPERCVATSTTRLPLSLTASACT